MTGFVIDYLLAHDPDFQAMVSRRGEAAKNLISALKQVLYGGKRSFLVNRSGALRREERDFAESEVGRLARVSFQERELTRKVKLSVRFFQFLFLVEIKRFFLLRQSVLPVTRDPARRRAVVSALLKIGESGLLGLVSRSWIGKRRATTRETGSSFRPAGG